LASEGATVNEAKPGFSLADHHETYLMHLSPIIGASFGPDEIALMERVARDLGPDDKSHNAIQARGTLLPHREWLLWNEIRAHMVAKWTAFFDDYDVLICPVTPTTAMPHDQDTPFGARKILVNGEARPYSDNIVWAGVADRSTQRWSAVWFTDHRSRVRRSNDACCCEDAGRSRLRQHTRRRL